MKNLILAFGIICSAGPGLAHAAEDVLRDLNLAQAKEVFGSEFQVSLSGTQARLRGMIFSDCVDKFVISSSISVQGAQTEFDDLRLESQGSTTVGFRIQDRGGQGLACVQAHKTANHSCGPAVPCQRISEAYPNAAMDLNQLQGYSGEDLNLGLYRVNYSSDVTPELFEAFAPNVVLIGSNTLQRRQQEADAEIARTRVRNLSTTVQQCIARQDGGETIRVALGDLLRLGAITQANYDLQIRQANELEFQKFEQALAAEEPDYAGVRDQMLAWVAKNPEYTDRVSTVCGNIIKANMSTAAEADASSDQIAFASETATQCGQLPGVSETARQNLNEQGREARFVNTALLAREGSSNFGSAQRSLLRDLRREERAQCKRNQRRTMEACTAIRTQIQAAQAMSRLAIQARMARAQNSINSYLSPFGAGIYGGMSMGMPYTGYGNPGMMGAGFGAAPSGYGPMRMW